MVGFVIWSTAKHSYNWLPKSVICVAECSVHGPKLLFLTAIPINAVTMSQFHQVYFVLQQSMSVTKTANVTHSNTIKMILTIQLYSVSLPLSSQLHSLHYPLFSVSLTPTMVIEYYPLFSISLTPTMVIEYKLLFSIYLTPTMAIEYFLLFSISLTQTMVIEYYPLFSISLSDTNNGHRILSLVLHLTI
ncbi:hypothetical protein BgiMline_005298 [Biomphalaria glabrata]